VPGSRRYNPGWHAVRDLRFMLTIAEAVLRAALERKESRGAHWRLDYPQKDPALGMVNMVAYDENGTLKIRRRQVPQMPPELAQLFEESSPQPVTA